MSINKIFVNHLNKLLDDIDMPKNIQEREVLFADMFDIPKHKSKLLLNGSMLPGEELVKALVQEFDVEEEWLLGKKG